MNGTRRIELANLRKCSAALAALGAALNLPACTLDGRSVAVPEMTVPVLAGEQIARDVCSGCHAVGRSGASPHPDARPFRTLSNLYPVSSLEEALAEGIMVGHPDMPPFRFEPDEVSALLDYIQSIQDPI